MRPAPAGATAAASRSGPAAPARSPAAPATASRRRARRTRRTCGSPTAPAAIRRRSTSSATSCARGPRAPRPASTWMELSISSILVILALGSAAVAAVILVWFIVKRPPMVWSTKVALLLGLGVFPIATAATGNVVGFQHTMSREFCSGCHVMEPFTDDVADPKSFTLAARHSRNPSFGDHSCYACHEDYGMFGAVTTKLNGMRHVYEYWTRFHSM